MSTEKATVSVGSNPVQSSLQYIVSSDVSHWDSATAVRGAAIPTEVARTARPIFNRIIIYILSLSGIQCQALFFSLQLRIADWRPLCVSSAATLPVMLFGQLPMGERDLRV